MYRQVGCVHRRFRVFLVNYSKSIPIDPFSSLGTEQETSAYSLFSDTLSPSLGDAGWSLIPTNGKSTHVVLSCPQYHQNLHLHYRPIYCQREYPGDKVELPTVFFKCNKDHENTNTPEKCMEYCSTEDVQGSYSIDNACIAQFTLDLYSDGSMKEGDICKTYAANNVSSCMASQDEAEGWVVDVTLYFEDKSICTYSVADDTEYTFTVDGEQIFDGQTQREMTVKTSSQGSNSSPESFFVSSETYEYRVDMSHCDDNSCYLNGYLTGNNNTTNFTLNSNYSGTDTVNSITIQGGSQVYTCYKEQP